MSKVGIIYWSSTGNTEAMAQAVEEGAKAAGADVEIMEVADADVDKALSYDVWHLVVRQWEMRSLRMVSSSHSSLIWKANFPVRKLRFSVPMTGATESG